VKTTNWEMLKPSSPFYLFIPQDITLRDEYEQYWKVTEMMPVNVLGFQTHRDDFAIAFEKQTIEERILEMRVPAISDYQFANKYGLKDNRDWNLNQARQILQDRDNWKKKIVSCLYRPFDQRYCYFSEIAMDYPRRDLQNHVLNKDNLCLGLGRQGIAVYEPIWFLIAVSYEVIDANIFRRGGVQVFPLYQYPTKTDEFINGSTKPARKPNFSDKFIKDVENRLSIQFIEEGQGDFETTVSATNIFHYMYAIFHAPSYRKRYAEFLKIDFPRLPLTSDKTLFQQLANLGKQLVTIHLMEADIDSDSGYPIEGNNLVDKITYQDEKVYINKTQYFNSVKESVWQFHIGGYQVCRKWLKDRKGRKLSYDDCNHYLYILAALEQTIDLMDKIDETLPEFPLS